MSTQLITGVLSEFPVLRRKQLLLRQVLPLDAPSIVEISYYDGVVASSIEDAVGILRKIEEDHARGESIHWGIYLAGAGRDESGVVGTCGFYRGFAGNVGEIGYVLRAAYRGHGIMTAAVKLVLAFGFEKMRLDSVVAYTAADNRSSIKVLENVGFERTAAVGHTLAYCMESWLPSD